GLATGDFNRDGIRDLVVAHGDSGTISVLLGQGSGGLGDGTFAPPVSYRVGSAPEQLATGDFNGDAIVDLAVVDPSNGGIYVLLGGGTGGVGDGTCSAGFSTVLVYPPIGVTAADLSGDGILDLVVLAEFGTIGVLLGNGAAGAGDGSFAAPVFYYGGPSP